MAMKTDTRPTFWILRYSALVLAAMFFCAVSLCAEEPFCKSKGGEVKVVYPDLARRMKIMGVVRLELQLSPSGSVRESKIPRWQSHPGIRRANCRKAGQV